MDALFDPNDRVGTGAESSYAAGLKKDVNTEMTANIDAPPAQ